MKKCRTLNCINTFVETNRFILKMADGAALIRPTLLSILLSLLLLSGCETSTDTNANTGDIAVRLVWPSPAEWLAKSTRGANARSDMPATTATIRIQVSGADMSSILRDFAASTHRGVIDGIPAGSLRRLTIQALNAAGILLADCERPNLFIEAGRTTQAGDCVFNTTSSVAEPQMISLPAGCFNMGSPASEAQRDSDETLHNVCVAAFAMGKYEVSFAEYDRFAEATGRAKPDDEGWGRGGRPVINVSWLDATEYAEWLSDETGRNYRLPTEAEWEYAARAGTSTPYHFGSDPAQLCQYGNVHDLTSKETNGFSWTNADCDDGYQYTAPVGQFGANAWGLHDVHGNVWEWSCSQYVSEYNGSEKVCLGKSDTSASRVLRGGSWPRGPGKLRAANRGYGTPSDRIDNVGFRLSRAN